MGDTFIRHIALLGFEKRFVPSQHYVSSLKVPCREHHMVGTVLSPWCYPETTWTKEGDEGKGARGRI